MTRPEDAVGMRESLTSRNVESVLITCALDINAIRLVPHGLSWIEFPLIGTERTGPSMGFKWQARDYHSRSVLLVGIQAMPQVLYHLSGP